MPAEKLMGKAQNQGTIMRHLPYRAGCCGNDQ
jgi:hypothetical protein